MSVLDDYAYIPTTWRAKAGGPDEDGVPTSYYSAVQLTCRAEIGEPQDKAKLLRRQLAHFQPHGDHAQVAVGMPWGAPSLPDCGPPVGSIRKGLGVNGRQEKEFHA